MGGLQDPILGQKSQFDVVGDKPFVQILHDGNNNAGHWVTVSNVQTPPSHDIELHDSMSGPPNTYIKWQCSSILMTIRPSIEMALNTTQRQKGGIDCGLYAIAAATSLCFGVYPNEGQFDQSQLRQHLLSCLEEGSMSLFPCLAPAAKPNVKRISIPVNSTCRLFDNTKERMAECSICMEWYHQSCLGVSTEHFMRIEDRFGDALKLDAELGI